MSADIQLGMPLLTWHRPPGPLLGPISSKKFAKHVFIYFYSYSYTPWDWWPGSAWRLWAWHMSQKQSAHYPYAETIFLLPYTLEWVAWERSEIVGMTRVPETISPLPIRGDNQPNHLWDRKPDAGHGFGVRFFRPIRNNQSIRNNQPIVTPLSTSLFLFYTHT